MHGETGWGMYKIFRICVTRTRRRSRSLEEGGGILMHTRFKLFSYKYVFDHYLCSTSIVFVV
jgi:hypothetical protein